MTMNNSVSKHKPSKAFSKYPHEHRNDDLSVWQQIKAYLCLFSSSQDEHISVCFQQSSKTCNSNFKMSISLSMFSS
eukprot:c39093_g1_i1 orf=125-352(+)